MQLATACAAPDRRNRKQNNDQHGDTRGIRLEQQTPHTSNTQQPSSKDEHADQREPFKKNRFDFFLGSRCKHTGKTDFHNDSLVSYSYARSGNALCRDAHFIWEVGRTATSVF